MPRARSGTPGTARLFLGLTLVELSRHDDAIRELKTAPQLSASPEMRAALAYAFARAGPGAGHARRIAKLLDCRRALCLTVTVAQVYAGFGEARPALEWLEPAPRRSRDRPGLACGATGVRTATLGTALRGGRCGRRQVAPRGRLAILRVVSTAHHCQPDKESRLPHFRSLPDLPRGMRHALMQPKLGFAPLPLHGGHGDPQRRRDFILTQAGEESEFHDLGLPRG